MKKTIARCAIGLALAQALVPMTGNAATRAARHQAKVEYKAAMHHCKTLSGAARKNCAANAKAAYERKKG